MTVYSRTFSRQVTNGIPAWASAMTATDTLYEVGARWDDATGGLNAKLVYPEGTNGGGLYAGTDGAFSPFHDAYAGSVFVPELGAHGGMVYGSTGENTIQEQLGYWAISKDAPTWEVFQQPDYALSAAAATARGASWYYNRTEFDALPAAKKMPFTAGTGNAEGSWGTATWDKTFPVGREGWIIPGKCGSSELGNNRPMAFRYNMPVYVPASMTGWGAGAIIINDRSFHGSFNGHSGPPFGVIAADWYTDYWTVSGNRKYRIFAMNVVTKQWSIIGTVPDFTITYAENIAHPFAFVDPVAKRVYYTTNAFSQECLYYVDFSSGADAATVATPVPMTPVGGGGADFSQTHSSAELFIGTSGALAGRKLFYYKNALNGLGMIDLSTNSIYRLTGITGLPPAGQWIFTVDHVNARVIITVENEAGNAITSTRFAIPNDPTSGANYSMSTVNLNMNGITLEQIASPHGWQYGLRGKLLTSVGNKILINQRYGKQLAYQPGA